MPNSQTEPDEPGAATGQVARWERHNSERQSLILKAAVELLQESPAGADVPVQQIAVRAGFAKSVVYRQFNGREDLDRRIRSFVADDFSKSLDAKLNIADGSLEEILTRTVRAVADWIADNPRLLEFMRTGPTDDDDDNIDGVASVKARIARRSRELIESITALIGVDSSGFESLPFAVVTMVEGTLRHWVSDPDSDKTRAEIVDDLAAYAWFVLDGASRSVGLDVDPKSQLVDVIKNLTEVRR